MTDVGPSSPGDFLEEFAFASFEGFYHETTLFRGRQCGKGRDHFDEMCIDTTNGEGTRGGTQKCREVDFGKFMGRDSFRCWGKGGRTGDIGVGGGWGHRRL